MSRSERIHAFAGSLVGIAVGLLFGLHKALLTGEACRLVPAAEIMRDATTYWGCAEFWAARYQTLFTGILALSAAAASVWAVRKQLAEQRRQFREQMSVAYAELRIAVAENAHFIETEIAAAAARIFPTSEIEWPTATDYSQAASELAALPDSDSFRSVEQFVGSRSLIETLECVEYARTLLDQFDFAAARDMSRPPSEVIGLFESAYRARDELRALQERMQVHWAPSGANGD